MMRRMFSFVISGHIRKHKMVRPIKGNFFLCFTPKT